MGVRKNKLYLHVGSHKTGTTALQEFLSEHRYALWRRGLWYPTFHPVSDEMKVSHNRLAHSLDPEGKSNSIPDSGIARLIGYWLSESQGLPILISGEAFWRHVDVRGGNTWFDQRVAYLERVRKSLEVFPVEIVVVLRRQDEFVHSNYLEHVMKGSKMARMPFHRYRELLSGEHLRYEDNLDAFRYCFNHLRVLVYDDLRRGGLLCRNFLAELGVDASDLPEPGRVRGSLPPSLARLKRKLIPLAYSRRQNERINALLRTPPAERLARRLFPDTGIGFWESEAVRREWQARHDEENERIRRRFLPERPMLFPTDDGKKGA